MSKMLKIDQIYLRAVMLCMSEMSKIDQIQLRAVMLCMSRMSKIDQIQSEKSFGKLRLRAFQPYHQILCMLKHVEDVEDYLCHLQHALIYTVFDGMVGKP